MPGRTFSAESSYRYGFNGKEKDLETAETTTYDYGFRIYNPGLGRFLSVDPLTKSYPWYTPYQFAGNMPIAAIDLDGLEPESMITGKTWGSLTKPMLVLMTTAFPDTYTEKSLKETTWEVYNSGDPSIKNWAETTGVPEKSSASVAGSTVVHDGDKYRTNKNWFRLIFHEQIHRQDISKGGGLLFYLGYAIEGICKGYSGISTEIKADMYGNPDGDETDYSAKLWNYKSNIVEKTLDNKKLTEDQKLIKMSKIGKLFRADELREKVNDINYNIELNEWQIAYDQLALKQNQNMTSSSVNFFKNRISNCGILNRGLKKSKEIFELEIKKIDNEKIKLD